MQPELTGAQALTPEARRELALALLNRTDARAVGASILRAEYPNAPGPMIDTAAFHLFDEGSRAVVDFLAELEYCLRERKVFFPGYGWEVLYHLYNWLQLQALLPHGMQDVACRIDEIKELIGDGYPDDAQKALGELADVLGAHQAPPEVVP
jgi:hypothetical protein